MELVHTEPKLLSTEPGHFLDARVMEVIRRKSEAIEAQLDYSRDYDFDYFGFKTLERAYLLRVAGKVVERPQHMFMRVALGIHCANDYTLEGGGGGVEGECEWDEARFDRDLSLAYETYHLMSEKWFIHASPTLFHAGTAKPQLSSCFLLTVADDSITGIYDTLKQW